MRKIICLVLSAFTLSITAVSPAHADKEFSNADVRGPYGFSFIGTAGGTPIAAIGQFVADGHGSFSGERTLNAGGVMFEQTFTCTYAVNPNGTGGATCTILPGSTSESFAFVLVDKGKAAEFISTAPAGVVVRGTSTKQ